ncbi:hypothetical protein [Ornithinimicrobium faecis]|uniref:Uncharacterized protein n=1 Tax=Ornithinimicrobium faecis TaxID=2934158 RepID=A0ABY4YPD8_9MICO|nr:MULTISPECIES: hypothetical protein [unclassified Ornithinimicrobium]USQ78641.1 hypothetical protein NF556_13500 [Ornithinimicrobium sp. HY1793]
MSHLIRSARVLLVAGLVLLVIGGGVLGTSLRAQQEARDDLTLLRVANDNLEMVMQARIDEVQGQDSLAFTPPDDDALAGHVDYVRELAPETSGPGLARLLALDETLASADDPAAVLMDVALALDALTWDTMDPVIDRLEAAQTRIWWSFWLTGLTVVALLCAALARVGDHDFGSASSDR